MIVYVESNFVLEVALGQEEAPAAEAILALAQSALIKLVIPAFALSEPFSTIENRSRERELLLKPLNDQARELGRSVLHQQFAEQLRPLPSTLLQIRKTQMDALEQTIEQLLAVSQSAVLDLATFIQARQYETSYGLKPKDAIIYAVVLAHLQRQEAQEAKCFISRDKGFNDPGIKAELSPFNCRYISNFGDGLRYVQRILNPPPLDSAE